MKGVRKLALLSTGFCIGVFAAHYIIAEDELTTAAVLCTAAALLSLIAKGKTRKRLLFVTLTVAVGLFYYKYTAELVLYPTEKLDGKTVTVTALVTDYPEYRESGVLLDAELMEDGLPQSDTLIVSYDKTTLDFKPGDIIKAEVAFSSAIERFGEYNDLYISKGLTATVSLAGEARVISHDDSAIKHFPKELAKELRTIIGDIFPEDTEAFMKALLTGDRSKLYEDVELDTAMAVSGITHVVAVSGMHVAFLVGFLQLILGQNRRLSLICIPTVWVFVLMVGAPPSAIRAGVMQTMLLSAPIFHRESDPFTTLSFALAVILLHNPFACGSVGLQLSFGAMAGIMLFSQRIYLKLGGGDIGIGRLRKYIVATLSSSLAVSVFTVPLIAIHFGYVALYSALTNILCLWIVSALFSGGLTLCLVSLISCSVASFSAELLSYGVRYIGVVVKLISKLPFSALYIENIGVLIWLFVTYLVFGICLARKGKGARSATLISIATLIAVIVGTAIYAKQDNGTVAALNVGNGQCLVFTAGDDTVVVDCGSARTLTNAGAELAKYLGANGRSHIDKLILTHLDDDHVNGLGKLMCFVSIDTLIMPQSAKYGDDIKAYRSIRKLANENGTEIKFINREERIELEWIELKFYTPYRSGSDSNNRGLTLTVDIDGYETLITGDAGFTVERNLVRDYSLQGTDLLIVGHHGSDYSCCTELVKEARPQEAIISVGYNAYGHPSYRVLTLLEVYGTDIHRTDQEGRVVIKIS